MFNIFTDNCSIEELNLGETDDEEEYNTNELYPLMPYLGMNSQKLYKWF